MIKAIVRIDIPTDYADEYKQWIIEGRLCYLEDNAWTHLKDVECKVEPYREAIPIEWFKKEMDWYLETKTYGAEVFQWVLNRWYEYKEAWEKENETN